MSTPGNSLLAARAHTARRAASPRLPPFHRPGPTHVHILHFLALLLLLDLLARLDERAALQALVPVLGQHGGGPEAPQAARHLVARQHLERHGLEAVARQPGGLRRKPLSLVKLRGGVGRGMEGVKSLCVCGVGSVVCVCRGGGVVCVRGGGGD
jgi:hypothetical protein